MVEEGIATWQNRICPRVGLFQIDREPGLLVLKAIEPQVKGYEVERCPLWLWEKAILDGYRVFRCLREQRNGFPIADLEKRLIEFRPLA